MTRAFSMAILKNRFEFAENVALKHWQVEFCPRYRWFRKIFYRVQFAECKSLQRTMSENKFAFRERKVRHVRGAFPFKVERFLKVK